VPVHLEVNDRGGRREWTVAEDRFWIGAPRSGCAAEIDLRETAGRILEVHNVEGGLRIRVEAGLPFPVRAATGTLGTRFETLLEGDVLNVGPALVRMRRLSAASAAAEAIDPAALTAADEVGTPVGAWYEIFMEVADSLEALVEPAAMVRKAMEAILHSTRADRVCVALEDRESSSVFHLTSAGSSAAFGVSQSLLAQARETGRVVHVPVASADPVASRIASVRREGISSAIAMPLTALGKTLGVLCADCVREGSVLTPADLQRVAFIGRLLAGALGNRDLVTSLVRTEPAQETAAHPALQTRSPACKEMVERVKMFAPTDYTVLIRGETGSGKELIAHALHDLSRRKRGPFVPVNCAAIPESLMESMLFGHEKGAFTGATQGNRGFFEEADGGTILLDEIGDMALDLQAKILRVLQDRLVTPVGSRRQIKVDVRVLAATHQDLERMVEAGTFREDLYYRLRELEVRLPALRERPEDLLMLCEFFLGEAARELGLARVPELTTQAFDVLRRHPWRGNIRELRGVIRTAALHAGGDTVRVEHIETGTLPQPAVAASTSGTAGSWKERLELQERAALQETLERAGGNLTKGAELFGVPRTTYREKLVKNGLLKGKEDE
jgi:transcriptional regulator with GAF, ATPase, and Fis domain